MRRSTRTALDKRASRHGASLQTLVVKTKRFPRLLLEEVSRDGDGDGDGDRDRDRDGDRDRDRDRPLNFSLQ